MSKLRVLLVGATAAGALASSSLLPAFADHAEPGGAPVSVVHSEPAPEPSGYLVIQGEGSDLPGPNHGYIGLDSEGDSPLVACYNGTYEPGEGNEVAIPPALPGGGGPTDDCDPPSGP